MLIGSHVKFNSKGQLLESLNEALSYGSTTFMFYTGAPQNTIRSKISSEITEKAKKVMKEHNMKIEDIIVHAPYIINLANDNDDAKYNFSINFLIQEVKRCEEIGIKYLVLHPGSHVGQGVEVGIDFIAEMLNEILTKDQTTIVLLETMSGKGSEVGRNFEELKAIIDKVKLKDKLGVCLDTCHIWDGGYDVVNNFDGVLNEFDKIIGLEKLKAIHLNDSKNDLASHKDRHEKIGEGKIGLDAISKIINNDRIKDLPFYLETPNEIDGYEREIELLKKRRI